MVVSLDTSAQRRPGCRHWLWFAFPAFFYTKKPHTPNQPTNQPNTQSPLMTRSGTGRGAFELAALDFCVEAVDSDAKMIAQLRESQARLPLDIAARIHARVGTAEDTGLPAESLSLATCLQAWHWVDHARAIKEAHRILKPNGLLCLVFFFSRRSLSEKTPEQHHGPHKHSFSQIWNDRNLDDGLVAKFEGLMEQFNPK
jgi:SAM-dependent methyltransferase